MAPVRLAYEVVRAKPMAAIADQRNLARRYAQQRRGIDFAYRTIFADV